MLALFRHLFSPLRERRSIPFPAEPAQLDDVGRYRLPTDFTKKKDTRRAAFVARYGDISVELDALPLDVLTDRLRQEVEARLDLTALRQVQEKEHQEKEQLVSALRDL